MCIFYGSIVLRLGVQKKDKRGGEYARLKIEHADVSMSDDFEFMLELR